MKKQIVLYLYFAVSILSSNGQSIYFYFTNGSNAIYPLNQVRSITFSGDVMNLNKTDGSMVSWNVSTINNYRYNAVTTGIEEHSIIENVKIFPNPTTGAINITYELSESENLTVEIFDQQGKLVKEFARVAQTGSKSITWQCTDLDGKPVVSGFYLCHFITNKQTFTEPIIIQQ